MVSIKILFQAYHCFILYINDLLNASELTDPRLFADDTSLIFSSHSNPNFLESVLYDKLHNIDVWLKCNKLSVINLYLIKVNLIKVNLYFYKIFFYIFATRIKKNHT